MKTNSLLAWVFIFFGALLLASQFNWLQFNRFFTVVIILLFFSILYLNRAFHHPDRRGLTVGTLTLLTLIMLILMKIGLLPVDDQLGFGLISIFFGAANLLYYSLARIKGSHLIIGLIFILIGIPLLFGYWGIISGWHVAEYYHRYWPLVIIVIGIGILLDNRLRKRTLQQK